MLSIYSANVFRLLLFDGYWVSGDLSDLYSHGPCPLMGNHPLPQHHQSSQQMGCSKAAARLRAGREILCLRDTEGTGLQKPWEAVGS